MGTYHVPEEVLRAVNSAPPKDRIRVLRQGLGLNQPQFAALIGQSPSTVCKWERMNRLPSLLARERIEMVFGVVIVPGRATGKTLADMTTGERIRALRLRRGLSQAALAEQIGVTKETIGQWERDLVTPILYTAGRLANALGVSVEMVLRGVEDAPREERLPGMTPGQRVRALRAQKGWMCSQLAECAGVAEWDVHAWESGKSAASYACLRKLAAALGVPVSLLAVGERGDPPVETLAAMPVGERIRVLRERRALPRRILARASGVPCGRLNSVEAGKCSATVEELQSLARALEVEPGLLTYGADAVRSQCPPEDTAAVEVMTPGERFRAMRKARGITQAKLAELAGLSKTAINEHESGFRAIKPEGLQRAAAALGVDVRELTGEDTHGIPEDTRAKK